MVIGIDANEANVDRRVGSGQYAYEIMRHMVQVVQQDSYVIYLKNSPKLDFPQPTETVNYRVFGPKPLWTQIALPLELYRNKKIDVFFSPAHYAPRFCPVPSVVTIHDLSYLKFKELFLKKDLKQLESWTKYSVKQARMLIVPSQATKKDVMEFYNFPENQIYVIPHGYDKSRFTTNLDSGKIRSTLQSYGIRTDYVLYLGTLQPRKNIDRLLEAYTKVIEKYPTVPLVIVGKRGWMYDNLFEKVKQLGLEQKVIFTDYVPDEEVPYFYAGALCYVNPSLYEGFGMPLIEAMACGTPVVAANVSSLPEFIGPGFLFDPYDVEAITKSIIEVISLPEGKRATLQQKSVQFANQFSWEKAAIATHEALVAAGEKP